MAEVIELVGATSYAERPIGELSGGEQQRLLIAQALARRPRLLILDEPLDSLDLPNQANVAALVSRICSAQGVAVLLVAHDVNPLLGYLDRVMYLAGGRAVTGPVEEVITADTLDAALRRAGRGPARQRRTARRGRGARGTARSQPPSRRAVTPSLSLNPLSDLQELVRFQFMVNALWAGTIVAVLAAVAGYLMILRRQAFAGHSLAVMAFPGATGAALVGLPATLGYYLACGAAALAMAAGRMPGRRASSETATIGTVQTVGLAAGFLFLSLNAQLLGGPESLLFGTFLGITSGQVLGLALVAAGCLAALAAMGRPLLFSSVDAGRGARGRGTCRTARPGLRARPGPCRGRHQPDHRRAARVRAARRPAGHGSASQRSAAARSGAERAARPRDRVAIACPRLLLPVSGRLLRELARVRCLSARPRAARPAAPAATADGRAGPRQRHPTAGPVMS